MATHSNNFIRVRLIFDFPPPAVVDCRMCWLLVDLNRCRVVSDLESLIREKFEFSRRSILSLFIDDCYLPHTESVYVVRDNDSVRVKVDRLVVVNGHGTSPIKESETCRKRQRPAEEDGAGEHPKKKKKKKRSEGSQERDAKQVDEDIKTKEKQKEKKKRKEAEENSPKAAAPTKKTPTSVEQPAKNTKKPPAKPQKASSSDSSSSSEEDEAPKKPAPQKPSPKATTSSPAASKVPQNTKKKPAPPSSSSETSSDEDDSVTPKNKLPTSTASKNLNAKSQQSTNSAQKLPTCAALPPSDRTAQSSSSESEEEIQLVIKRPIQPAQQLGRGTANQPPWRGRGRGKTRGGGPVGRGRGEGRGHNNSFEYSGANEPSYQTDSLTNKSVVIQNGAESVPKPDYSSMPLLAAPPQAGQKIAFKLLELTENYTPEVSEYKEGKIVNFDPMTKQVELELLHTCQTPVEPGKFDLVYQNPDGSERVEYAVSRDSRVTERWDSLLEPRLIL
ncbi:coilin [Cheilinus undulatus]|uniref:coilin n=1 Tax=Cheilinus undulatus TaxID=241271 RepID=UPI001BD6DE8B|nr:coilin [Cheilinus undulatus]